MQRFEAKPEGLGKREHFAGMFFLLCVCFKKVLHIFKKGDNHEIDEHWEFVAQELNQVPDGNGFLLVWIIICLSLFLMQDSERQGKWVVSLIGKYK
ncbi:MAG: hypothetical protein KKC76_20015 [Proteobacteria bacterium]|nr:hypothetical protein [Pseudomonadota bacterium]MBU4295916.1 hypothetical protein [Pseudomonadota bacterium]MCG2747777.1 hypothetical protein [Desulfobulbaceae bacterium]